MQARATRMSRKIAVRSILRIVASVGCMLAVAILVGFSRQDERAPNVVVLVLNEPALDRADGASAAMPAVEALLREGALAGAAYLPTPGGRPSDAVLLTGRHPHQSGIQIQAARPALAAELSVAGVLSRAGYATFAAGRVPGPAAVLGFDAGGEAMDPASDEGRAALFDALKARDRGAPFFLWWAPDPARPAEWADAALAALRTMLAESGPDGRTLFVVLRDRRRASEGSHGSESSLCGSIAFHLAGEIEAGEYEGLVTSLDVVPTILDYADVAAPDGLSGVSLRAALEDRGVRIERDVVHGVVYRTPEELSPRAPDADVAPAMFVARTDRWKYVLSLVDEVDEGSDATFAYPISAGQQQLFDLENDPEERFDVSADLAHASQLASMRRGVLDWWEESGGIDVRLPPLFTGLPPVREGTDGRPNIVLIISDDHDYKHLGFMGHEHVRMPTTDALADAGVVFGTAHVSMSRGRPSLATLLSGRYPHQMGILDNQSVRPLNPRNALPGLLKRAGYATFVGGKFWEGNHHSMGFIAPERRRPDGFVREDQDELFAFLDDHAARRPFFVWWAPLLPHAPFDAPASVRARFDGIELVGDVPASCEDDAEAWAERERTSFAMEAWFDDGLSALCEKLRELGEFENTLFCFLIDNGWSNAYPSKGAVTEQGIRTPIFFSWSGGFAGGRRNDSLVSSADVYPTLLDFANVRVPASAVGRSLRADLEGRPPDEPARDVLCGAAFSPAKRATSAKPERDIYALYARTREWKYVLYVRRVRESGSMIEVPRGTFPARDLGDEDLYRLSSDPDELIDLSSDPVHRDRIRELRAAALGWWEGTGGPRLKVL